MLDSIYLIISFILAILAILIELYVIYSILLSRFCKYPPAFPTFGTLRKKTLAEAEKILSQSSKNLKVVDLGCGAGGLLLPLAKKYPNHQFVGYDWDWFMVKWAGFRGRKLKNLKIIKQDISTVDVKEFDLLFSFLDTKALEIVYERIYKEISPSAILISPVFALPKTQAIKEIEAKSYCLPLKIYVYSKSRNNL